MQQLAHERVERLHDEADEADLAARHVGVVAVEELGDGQPGGLYEVGMRTRTCTRGRMRMHVHLCMHNMAMA